MLRELLGLLKGIVQSARRGQKLPLLTLLIFLQLGLHCFLLFQQEYLSKKSMLTISWIFLVLNVIVIIAGYVLLIKLYKHSVQHIFNKQIPSTWKQQLPSFLAHLSMLRPLEIIFRFLTHKFRVLPDILVLGEVRCGTTTLCQQLSELNHSFAIHTPFCLWAHPELDHKETFYFVGHYLQQVNPKYYSMCFPLKITKYMSQLKWKVWKRLCFWRDVKPMPFLTFDGCAQYLTSPTAPYLIAKVYRDSNQPLPVLIACVRDPTSQAISWFRYEWNAIKWGEGMGLMENNVSLRGEQYPPKTIKEALAYGQSETVSTLYANAEKLFSENKELKEGCVLPDWAMTWPGGQLSGIGRNAQFAENINRYETVFQKQMGEDSNELLPQQTMVNILPLQQLKDMTMVKSFLVQVLENVAFRRNDLQRQDFFAAVKSFQESKNNVQNVHRNSIAAVQSYGSIDNGKEKEFLEELLKMELSNLESLCKERNVKWM